MTAVGNRITKARSAVEATIASYIAMYKAMEPNVPDLESASGQLVTELGVTIANSRLNTNKPPEHRSYGNRAATRDAD